MSQSSKTPPVPERSAPEVRDDIEMKEPNEIPISVPISKEQLKAERKKRIHVKIKESLEPYGPITDENANRIKNIVKPKNFI